MYVPLGISFLVLLVWPVQAQNVFASGGLIFSSSIDDDYIATRHFGVGFQVHPRTEIGLGYQWIKYDGQSWVYPYIRQAIVGHGKVRVHVRTGLLYYAVHTPRYSLFENRLDLVVWAAPGLGIHVDWLMLFTELRAVHFLGNNVNWSGLEFGLQIQL